MSRAAPTSRWRPSLRATTSRSADGRVTTAASISTTPTATAYS